MTARTDRAAPDDLRRRPRQRRAHDTVAFLLEAAAQLFAERGYDATTTNAVAERAGVSIGTLYQYFANKDGLLLGLLGEHLDAVETLTATRFRAVPPGRPEAAAVALVGLAVEQNTRPPQLATLLHEQARRSPAVQSRLAELRRTVADHVAARLTPEAADVAGRSAAVRLRVELCVRVVEHLVHATALDPPPGASRDDVLAEITGIATRCLSG